MLAQDSVDFLDRDSDPVHAFGQGLDLPGGEADRFLPGADRFRPRPHRGDDGVHVGFKGCDAAADVVGGAGRLVGEVFHFGGHHGKTLAGFPRSRRLDGGVEGE